MMFLNFLHSYLTYLWLIIIFANFKLFIQDKRFNNQQVTIMACNDFQASKSREFHEDREFSSENNLESIIKSTGSYSVLKILHVLFYFPIHNQLFHLKQPNVCVFIYICIGTHVLIWYQIKCNLCKYLMLCTLKPQYRYSYQYRAI